MTAHLHHFLNILKWESNNQVCFALFKEICISYTPGRVCYPCTAEVEC